MERELLTPKEVAEMLGVSKVTVLRLLRDGKLPYQRIGHRTLRIRREDVQEFLASTRKGGR